MGEAYLRDTPYIWGAYNELSPLFLNYICALNGHRSPDIEKVFTYCELGSGNGVTVTALAELYPHGSFYAIDFNQVHIDNSNFLVSDTDLKNIGFYKTDFNDLKSLPGPDFDYIVLHGVYSWVNAKTRDNIRKFIASRLKKGGIVYLSYDSLPGWSAITPLRDMVITHTTNMSGDSLTKTQAGLDFLEFLKSNKAAFFEDNLTAVTFLEQIKDLPLDYVSHEFFGDSVQPAYFQNIAHDMESAGLVFSGSAIPHLNFIDLAAPSEFHDLLKKSATRIEFETHGDFIRNQRFRRDVFIRSENSMSEKEQEALLMNLSFGTICVQEDFKRSVAFGDVALNYVAGLFENLIQELCTGAKSINQLTELSQFSAYQPALILDAVRFLTAGGQVTPFSHATDVPAEKDLTANRYTLGGQYNLQILKHRLFAQESIGFAAINTGIVAEVAMSDALFALCTAEAERDHVSDWAFQRLLEKRQEITTEHDDQTQALAEAVGEFRRKRLPKFLEFGILTPVPD